MISKTDNFWPKDVKRGEIIIYELLGRHPRIGISLILATSIIHAPTTMIMVRQTNAKTFCFGVMFFIILSKHPHCPTSGFAPSIDEFDKIFYPRQDHKFDALLGWSSHGIKNVEMVKL